MSLLLHAGAQSATKFEVFETPTPPPTDTHFPVPHGQLVQKVTNQIEAGGWKVTEEEFGLWGDENEMLFALLQIANGKAHDDYGFAIGLRNAHNKRFAASLALGNHVFVCDNLSISGEITFGRKHTRHIARDLDRLIAEAMGRLWEGRNAWDQRIQSYKDRPLSETEVHDILIRSMDAKVMANSYITKVLDEWRTPTHEEFLPRNAWSLHNAYTQVFKATNPLDLSARTTRLHGLMDLVAETGPHSGERAALPLVTPPHGMEGLLNSELN